MSSLSRRHHVAAAFALVLAFTVLVRWIGLDLVFPALGPPGGVLVLIIQFGLIGVALRLAGVRLAQVGWSRAPWLREVVLGVLGAVLLGAGLVALLAPLGALDVAATARKIADFTPGERVRFAVIGIQAALAEETVFRGYLQGALAPRIGTTAAIIIVAAVFALSHLSLAPMRLLGLCWIGLVLGVMRGADRPLWSPAIAHALLWAVWGDA